jgi:hypothetical protein
MVTVLSACLGNGITEPEVIGDGRRVLFIGNSYLYTEDIPGIVQALADSAGGDRLAVATVAAPDFALIDHWHEGTARREIAKGGWEWVVLQQGPSSAELNRDTLRLATGYFAGDMAKVNARPALFSAWPRADRRQDFPRAIESYALAATDVNGLLLPVAGAWLEAWARDPGAVLYSDGLHPSREGAYLSALVIYSRLLGKSPLGLPPAVRLRSGAVVAVSAERAALLQEAAAQATTAATEVRRQAVGLSGGLTGSEGANRTEPSAESCPSSICRRTIR